MEKSKLILYFIIVQRKRRSTQKYTDSPPQDFVTGGFFEGLTDTFIRVIGNPIATVQTLN